MKTLATFVVVGIITVVALRVFKFEQEISDRIIAGVKTRDPEQMVLALTLTVGLGIVAVVASQTFRKVA